MIMSKFDVVEASIADLRAALEDGRTTSVELVEAYQDRIAALRRSRHRHETQLRDR
jgi:Asp-tRNA(Asn)/Glu-tRNA(Gln) amidotransferase A subunit family amidase